MNAKPEIRNPQCRGLCLLAAIAQFLMLNPQPASAQSPVPDEFNPGADGWVNSLAVQADGRILVGGYFTTLGGQTRKGIGRLNADGTLDTGFNPGTEGGLYGVLTLQANGKILVGGSFTTLGGQWRTNIGRLNADGTLDSGFNPGTDGEVKWMVVAADGNTLVGGDFNTLGGQARDGIARLFPNGTLDSGFNPGAPGGWAGAMQANGKILVGGELTHLAGKPRDWIGRLNADGTLDTEFNPGANDTTQLAVQANGKILVYGLFTRLAGQTRNYIGRLNEDGTLDTGFNPGANGNVYSLAVQTDGKILVGGEFTMLGGQPRNYIGRLNENGTLDSGFNPGVGEEVGFPFYFVPFVESLAVQADGKILVGGSFTTLGGQPRTNIGRLYNTGPATQSLNYSNSTITWLRGGTSPEVWRTTFDYSTNGVTWVSLGAGTRINGGWQMTGVSVPSDSTVRARGYGSTKFANGHSDWFVESRITPQILLGISQNGSHVVLNWTGGQGPYQVQQTPQLGSSNFWQNLGEPVTTNSLSLPLGSSNLFLRVRGH